MQINEKVETARIGVAAVGVTIWGMTLNEWVAIATGIYLALQILILLPKGCDILQVAWQKIRSRKNAP